METTHHLVIEREQAGERLDVLVAGAVPELSRSQAKRLIDDGFILVDGEEAKPAAKVRAGDEIEVTIPPPTAAELVAEPIPLDVLFEDDWLIAVNKPPGMVVHPAAGNWTGTLVNALLHHCRRLSESDEPMRPGIVHRLDKDTSGVIVAAKDTVTHWKLAEQFAAREIEKEYRVLVGGVPAQARLIVTANIARHPRDRKRMHATDTGGRKAETVLELIEAFDGAAYLRALPKTGRTHQIRVHCAHVHRPVLGDTVYGRGKAENRLGIKVARQMLHAHRLAFIHPATGRPLELTAPLPVDFEEVLAVLRG
ncbi:MAG: RluA family pseudouridine synthase [Verrucomicrobia bacterium]|nr:RluA family pseudouridine synthase [Verrucomicrobiota bacterium]